MNNKMKVLDNKIKKLDNKIKEMDNKIKEIKEIKKEYCKEYNKNITGISIMDYLEIHTEYDIERKVNEYLN